jgi:flagellar hook protein FlgE
VKGIVVGIFGAMTTSIGGLRAQSYALENISNNIANSQTTGYKRTDTTFIDMVPDSPARAQESGGVRSASRPTNTSQGDISNADVSTFMAISGDGYFIVGEKSGMTDGKPLFDDQSLYTRRGDFETDKFGHLVNGSGYYLKGLAIDKNTGNVTGSSPEVITISNDFLSAEATTKVDYRANLASYPRTANADESIPNSELLSTSLLTGDDVTGDDAASFIDQTIAGSAATVYNESGAAANMQFRWGKIDNASQGTGHADTWRLFYLADSDATGTNVAWKGSGVDYTFDESANLSPAIGSITLSDVVIDGIVVGDIKLDHGSNGITQFANSNGVAKITDIDSNGYAAGELSSVSISDDGRVVASYSNGEALEVADVTLASFNGDGYLEKRNGGVFKETPESGSPILGASGTIIGSSLEDSNTDIADEFSKLIVTQQAYAANTRIISTSEEMLEETLSMVR